MPVCMWGFWVSVTACGLCQQYFQQAGDGYNGVIVMYNKVANVLNGCLQTSVPLASEDSIKLFDQENLIIIYWIYFILGS